MFRPIFAVAIGLAIICGGAAVAQEIPLDKITLPPGFSIEVYASGVPNARSMALSPTGTLFVSTRQAGSVYAVLDRDQVSDYRRNARWEPRDRLRGVRRGLA